jgi:hypothetical protein
MTSLPPLKAREVIKGLQALGFERIRQKSCRSEIVTPFFIANPKINQISTKVRIFPFTLLGDRIWAHPNDTEAKGGLDRYPR